MLHLVRPPGISGVPEYRWEGGGSTRDLISVLLDGETLPADMKLVFNFNLYRFRTAEERYQFANGMAAVLESLVVLI